ncbi:transcription elongation factor, mitochondrial isoform X2 [Hemicordylus capensis]|uniref:transcription elongation factor, mitochondrial isoform X2 n=1 Tax=Hemicordylus capensis TaxID=884348 RepID=UPI0023022FB3|nr:transcription elongation factor, mitochondrial isoform X2 [Hemicordylus capensis]
MSFKRLPDLLQRGRKYFLQVPLSSSRLQPLYLLWCHKKSTSVGQKDSVDSSSVTENFKEATHAIDDLYSSEQRSTVLQLLNSASEEELSSVKLMRGRKSINVIEYRNEHGPFQDLQSLLQVPQFQYKTAVKVCNFILNPLAKQERKEKKTHSATSAMKFIKPEIEREKLETVNSIVSIVFGTRKIAWAHVNRQLGVQDWQQQECTVFMKGAYMPTMYLEEISSVVSKIPKADFYVLEKSGLSTLNASLFPVVLHLRTVEAMLYALLHKTFSHDSQHVVLSMARSAVGKHFGLMVGDTRTSGIELVKQLLLEAVTQTEPSVSFPRDKVGSYRSLLSLNKQWRDEELCDSLLQAVAFFELLILNNTT